MPSSCGSAVDEVSGVREVRGWLVVSVAEEARDDEQCTGCEYCLEGEEQHVGLLSGLLEPVEEVEDDEEEDEVGRHHGLTIPSSRATFHQFLCCFLGGLLRRHDLRGSVLRAFGPTAALDASGCLDRWRRHERHLLRSATLLLAGEVGHLCVGKLEAEAVAHGLTDVVHHLAQHLRVVEGDLAGGSVDVVDLEGLGVAPRGAGEVDVEALDDDLLAGASQKLPLTQLVAGHSVGEVVDAGPRRQPSRLLGSALRLEFGRGGDVIELGLCVLFHDLSISFQAEVCTTSVAAAHSTSALALRTPMRAELTPR